jgi:hypothetical protein
MLEYDSERAGSFEALRFVPKGKIVVLGLVTTKSVDVETVDFLQRRIEEASRYIPVEQLKAEGHQSWKDIVAGKWHASLGVDGVDEAVAEHRVGGLRRPVDAGHRPLPVGGRQATLRRGEAGSVVIVRVYRLRLSRGSSKSRRPSPNRLRPSTVNAITKPGIKTRCGARWRSVWASASILPQEGCGGCAPSPR